MNLKVQQPQYLKDSYVDLKAKQAAAEKGFADAIKKFENKEINQKQLTAELKKLEASYTKALEKHKENWKKYEKDVAKMIQTRDPDRNITVTSLDKITAGIVVDGKPLSMSPGGATRRKEALEALKAGLGNAYKPENPNFAKMEAIGNFAQKIDNKGNPVFSEPGKPTYTTTVNGVHFDFIQKHNVSPEKSIVVADGANWMKLSQAAKDSGIESIGLTSVKRDDSSSHGNGYSFDVGSVTDLNGKEILIKHNDDFLKGQIIEPKPPLDKFLDKISGESSNKFSYNPYYMVDGNGNKTPNFFTAVDEKNWGKKNWDDLTDNERKEFGNAMKEMAAKYTPPYTLTDNDTKQMWDHRHHLHITEVSK
ncbi:hypothetical protein AB3N60_15455 [Leptospira sp. WS39.C2]